MTSPSTLQAGLRRASMPSRPQRTSAPAGFPVRCDALTSSFADRLQGSSGGAMPEVMYPHCSTCAGVTLSSGVTVWPQWWRMHICEVRLRVQ